jgi:hypothetical protein
MAKRAATRSRAQNKPKAKPVRRTTASGAGRGGPHEDRKSPRTTDALTAPMKGAEGRTVGHVRLDVAKAGSARVKRLIYPAGFKWSVDMKPVTGGDYCMHAHIGFLARGRIRILYADGCRHDFKAPQVVAIDPGHDGWVLGDEPAVLIEIDFERDTVARLGMPAAHQHA